MTLPTTEKLHDEAPGLDTRPLEEAAGILARAQIEAAQAVLPALSSLADGARAMATSLKRGGRLFYVGAGSSGLMAVADALELGGTFGIAPDRIRIVMAGGLPRSASMPGETEDSTAGLATALDDVTATDTLVAVAASGATPFTLAATERARAAGATIIGLANNSGSQLLAQADIAVALPTPPEVVSGSTRLGAATAQKIALNTMSTLMGMALGHVHDGMMVNVVADNAKLKTRAATMVERIACADPQAATAALAAAAGDVKAAVLIAAGAGSLEAARARLAQNDDHLRGALAALHGN